MFKALTKDTSAYSLPILPGMIHMYLSNHLLNNFLRTLGKLINLLWMLFLTAVALPTLTGNQSQ